MQVLSEFRRHSIEQVGETVNRHQVRAEGNFVYARGGEKDRLFLLVQLPGVEVVVGFGVLFDDRLMLVPLQDAGRSFGIGKPTSWCNLQLAILVATRMAKLR